jgi:nitrile hydratase alpha subunit
MSAVHESGFDVHQHDPAAAERNKLPYWGRRVHAIRELLIEKGVLAAEDIQRQVEYLEKRSPANGARLVARAWVDPRFKELLLSDPKAACAELGIDAQGLVEFVVLENTEKVHNLVVCTLCSCYPWSVLGLPPVWYKSAPYRSRAVIDPRGVLREFGFELAEDVEVRVWDSTAELRYLVLPERPAGGENLSEDDLAALVTRDAMVGVGRVASSQAGGHA